LSAPLAQGADYKHASENYLALLLYVSGCKSSGIVQTLVEAGAQVNAKNDDGSTALMAAALKGDADIVQILLSAGADIKVKDKDEDTALNLAAQNGQQRSASIAAAGADLNLTKWGETALNSAIEVKPRRYGCCWIMGQL